MNTIRFLFYFMIVFGGYLLAKGNANSAQLIFRVLVLLIGVVGTVVLYVRDKNKNTDLKG